MDPEREPTPEKKREDLIYLAENRQFGHEAGRRLDEAFDPDTMTGLSLFLSPQGPVHLVAVFDPKVKEEALRKARAILSEFCQESPLTLEDLLEMAFHSEFSEVYIGAASSFFLGT